MKKSMNNFGYQHRKINIFIILNMCIYIYMIIKGYLKLYKQLQFIRESSNKSLFKSDISFHPGTKTKTAPS